ncbi:hypothetical protein DFH11DRAFT_1725360 [Phellopilus nigrolimitatus]|nr:hypothetical protein DFH11DRAFT_1725360 [Phellopilus nigrolimitatus]
MSRLHYPHMAVMPWEAEDKEICPYLARPSTRAERIISSELVDPRFLAAFISGELATRAQEVNHIKPADSTIPSGDSAQGPEVGGGSAPSPTESATGDATATSYAQKDVSGVTSGATDAVPRRGDGPTIPQDGLEAETFER